MADLLLKSKAKMSNQANYHQIEEMILLTQEGFMATSITPQ
jgi:hypothetical protein